MPAVAGYLTTVKLAGTPTALSDEAMTNTSGNEYQVTDTTRRVLDRDTVPTFEDTGVSPQAIDASDITSIDYVFGKVVFATSKTGPVVVKTGNYLPLTNVAGSHSYGLNLGGDVLDDTDYPTANANNGQRSRILGIRDVSLTIARWDQGTSEFYTALQNRTPLLIEVRPGGAGDFARGWYVPESEDRSGDVSSLESADLSFQLDGSLTADFGWGT